MNDPTCFTHESRVEREPAPRPPYATFLVDGWSNRKWVGGLGLALGGNRRQQLYCSRISYFRRIGSERPGQLIPREQSTGTEDASGVSRLGQDSAQPQ
jgi:hypothetical protein